jgi:hypothetical protein
MQWLKKFGSNVMDFFETVTRVRLETEMRITEAKQKHQLGE